MKTLCYLHCGVSESVIAHVNNDCDAVSSHVITPVIVVGINFNYNDHHGNNENEKKKNREMRNKI